MVDLRPFHAAVIVAADRVADLEPEQMCAVSWAGRQESEVIFSPEVRALRHAVAELRAAVAENSEPKGARS